MSAELLEEPPGVTIPIPDLAGAACKGMDTNLWYTSDPEGKRFARSVCAVCPVKARCLQWALEAGEKDGMWGGLDDRQRYRLRRRMR